MFSCEFLAVALSFIQSIVSKGGLAKLVRHLSAMRPVLYIFIRQSDPRATVESASWSKQSDDAHKTRVRFDRQLECRMRTSDWALYPEGIFLSLPGTYLLKDNLPT